MSDHHQHRGRQHTRARVSDRRAAERIVSALGEEGIPPERCDIRPLADTAQSPRATGEQDLGFTESAGKTMGVGWLVGALIGAVVGAIAVSLLFAPPWESGAAAAITLAVAIGVGYIAGGMGFLQAGISRAGETGGKPLTRQDPGHTEEARSAPGAAAAPGEAVDLVVHADSAQELERARTVFSAHRVEQID